jgi:hypothetical protein
MKNPKEVRVIEGERSLAIKMFNLVKRRSSIKLDKIINKAQNNTKTEFDKSSKAYEGAQRLVEDINRNSSLTGYGTFFCNEYLLRNTINCLEITKQKKKEKLELEKEPVFILGLPRTGSTFFFNLLSKDTQFRTLNFWETSNYSKLISDKQKIKKAKMVLKGTNIFAPKLKAIHEVRLEGPGECTQILTNSFNNISFGCYFFLPEYSKWVLGQKQTETYEIHKQQLCMLDQKKRWLLKGPPHLMNYEDIIKVYPNAKIIQLHRDPVAVVGSASSLIAASRSMFTDRAVLKQTGDDISRVLKWSLEKTMKERSVLEPKNITDVYFNDLMSDPIGTIKSIYKALNLEWSESLESILDTERQVSKRNKFGKHVYDLNDYGLSKELIREKFNRYIQKYNL